MKKMMKKQSLTGRTVKTTIISSFIFAFISLFIGLSVYGSGLIKQYVRRSFETASQASVAATRAADSVKLSKQVMEIYRSLTPEEREAEDYLDHFSSIDTVLEKGEEYDVLFHMLQGFIIGVDDVYLGMYDRDTNALVYIVDPDRNEETRLMPGEWERVSEKECRKFLQWDGEGMLYDISDTEKYGWMCTAGYPIRDEKGQICEFVLVDVMLDSVMHDLIDYALKITLALLAATALIAWLVSRHMKKTVVEPINNIARAATAYVEDKKEGVERSHFDSLGDQSGLEIENLARVMADMESELTQHEERITRITAEKERINTELRMANQIQKNMLPHLFPPFPERTEFDLYASMDPARSVGGDFYDYYMIDEDHLCLVIADVSGKGIPASLFMMVSKVILQSCAMLGRSAAEILDKTNEAICSNNPMNMFVTVWIGILEISTGRLTAANAGHEYPILKSGQNPFEVYRDRHSLVVGAVDVARYREYEILLKPGDKIFLYTDGVPEALNAGQEMFGMERMTEALNEVAQASPMDVIKNVRRSVDDFVENEEQFDDLTMLCLEYNGI